MDWLQRPALLAGLLAFTLAGCSNTGTTVTQQHEPLLGVRTPPSSITTPTPAGHATTPSVPPTPQTFNPSQPPVIPTSSNPASLAGTHWQGPLGRPLAMDDHNSTGPSFLPGQLTSTSRTPPAADGYLPPNPNPKVEPVPDANPSPKSLAPTTWQTQPDQTSTIKPTTALAPAGKDAILKELRDAGVVDQIVETTPEGLRLTCYVRRDAEGRLRILGATAADYPTAARAILQQLRP
jgi:hypothetical protein